MDVRHDTLELARFLAELSVIDYFFVTHKPSVVGLAALLNAMEAVPGVSISAKEDFVRELKRVPGLQPNGQEVEECRSRLRLLYAQGGYSRPESTNEETRSETISPVCVSYGCHPQAISAYDTNDLVREEEPKQVFTFLGVDSSHSQFHIPGSSQYSS